MAGEDAVSTCARKALKMEDELDNLPLAVSRGKNASASKVKKEEDDDDSDNMPIAHSRAKKVCFVCLSVRHSFRLFGSTGYLQIRAILFANELLVRLIWAFDLLRKHS
jgi:hypothetical protein